MNRITDVDLKLLRLFVTVAEARGFAAAGSFLNVSTSTISVHVANLETRLGFRLCQRGRGGFMLTERGRFVLQEARALLQSLDDFSGRLSSVKSLIGGRLAIGMVDAIVGHSAFPVSEAIRRFNERDNDVQIELVVGSPRSLEHDVVEGRLHAAVGPILRDISGLSFIELYSERHDLYCGVGHPLFGASLSAIEATTLSGFSAVVRLYQREFDHQRLGIAREKALVNSMEGMLALLLSGNYIGFLPQHYARDWVAKGMLAAIARPDMGYESQHALMVRTDTRDSAALSLFVSTMGEVCRLRRGVDDPYRKAAGGE